jgi:ornithine cyclodeaminase/alanine dehydrogenase-like protein (mu-crystallin family)
MSDDVWDAARLRAEVTPERAVAALRSRLLHDAPAADRPVRGRYPAASGTVLVMPDESRSHVGVKVVSLAPDNPTKGLPSVQGSYLLMDAHTLSPQAVIDAAELTLLRTAAVSLLAVLSLRPSSSPRVVVVGSGPQAVAHAEAAQLLAPSSVQAVVRGDAGLRRLSELAAARGVDVEPCDASAIADADVVLCCTSSRVPVLRDADVGDVAVVTAIGAHEPDARELPGALVARSFLVVESRSAARAEAGDVVLAEQEAGRELVAADLGEVVRGQVVVDGSRARVFKSVGEAWEDLAVAALVDS